MYIFNCVRMTNYFFLFYIPYFWEQFILPSDSALSIMSSFHQLGNELMNFEATVTVK